MPEALAVNGRPGDAASRQTRGATIASVGVAVPTGVVGNDEIAARLGVTDRWIVVRTGVRERRVAAAGETVVDYAVAAGRRALADAQAQMSQW